MAIRSIYEKIPQSTTLMLPVLPVRDTILYPGLVTTIHVARDASVQALQDAKALDHLVFAATQRDEMLDSPGHDDLASVGTLCEVVQSVPLPDGSFRSALQGVQRARAIKVTLKKGVLWAEIEGLEEKKAEGVEVDALMRAVQDTFTELIALHKQIPPESLHTVLNCGEAGRLADSVAHLMPLTRGMKQEILETLDEHKRLEMIFELLKKELQIKQLDSQLHKKVEAELGQSQREFYLREQLRVIQDELLIHENREPEGAKYRRRFEEAEMPEEAKARALSELERLERAPHSSPEALVMRNYLDCLIELPWNRLTEDRLDLAKAAKTLDEHHFGLDSVKERVLDFLAVRRLKSSLRGPILCFVGPPGVGKTSFARSIADALGRKYARISLGGVRDEAEIRGHRRTYVGSMPGRIISELRACGVRNPVIVLDEIDKLGNDYHGDPTSALLEALDPEQQATFRDHFLELPFDLSSVMFVTTANSLEGIPAPLRDRMEIVTFESYTDEEKLAIAQNYLLPSNLKEHGLNPDQLILHDKELAWIMNEYTREAGVRDLGRQLGTVCRKAARQIAEGKATKVEADSALLKQWLGRPRYSTAAVTRGAVGVANGLVVGFAGGDVIQIEASLTEKLKDVPELRLTGSLGEVMKESAEAALTFVRSHRAELGIKAPVTQDVHVHVPMGGVPKDGPSAGVTIAVALASALSGRAVRSHVAMTGEMTLRGRVLAVGGIRDKWIAAQRAGCREILIPRENEPDLEDLPKSIRESLQVHLIDDLLEAIQISLD